MTIQLTAFGGTHEIGGNAFLLEVPGLRVMLDMGKRFGSATTMAERGKFAADAFDRQAGFGDYFDSFQKVRAGTAVRDLGSLDLIPWRTTEQAHMPALYRTDLGGVPGEAPIDLVLLSHAHVDHCGLIGLLRPDIPVATSPQSVATLQSIETTGIGGWETDYTDVRVRGGLERKEDGSYTKATYRGDERGVGRRFLTDGKIQQDGKWTIEFHQVDHSIQGAAGCILSDGDTKIVYSGDFRQHGLSPEKTRAFLKAAANPDVLIIEGTRVGHDHAPRSASDGPTDASTDKESDVEQQVQRLIEAHEAAGGPPFVGIGYPPRDLDRFRSLHNVARRIGRRLLLNTKQAHLIDTLRAAGAELPDWRTDPNLAAYLGTSNVLREPGRLPLARKADLALEYIQVSASEWAHAASKELDRWEFDMLGGKREQKIGKKGVPIKQETITQPVPFGDAHIVSTAKVQAEPGAYILSLSLFNMTDLFDVFPDRANAGGLYIHSLTQPHNDDMEMDQFRLRRWLRAFHLNAPDHEPKRTHVSGHVSQGDLDTILDELQPKVLVPIHSERPDLTSERFSAKTGRRAVVPRWGHAELLG